MEITSGICKQVSHSCLWDSGVQAILWFFSLVISHARHIWLLLGVRTVTWKGNNPHIYAGLNSMASLIWDLQNEVVTCVHQTICL